MGGGLWGFALGCPLAWTRFWWVASMLGALVGRGSSETATLAVAKSAGDSGPSSASEGWNGKPG